MVTIGLFKIALLYHCLISSFQKLALGAETECIEANIDFYGEDTKFAVAETALACACECRKQAGCLVFSWIAKDNACWMKTSEKGRRKKIGVYSGSVDCCQVERCDSLIVDPNEWSGNFQGHLLIQVPSNISSYKIELETDNTHITNIKFWNGNVFPTMGNSFTVTNPRWFNGTNAGDYLDLGFQMSFAGNRNPTIKNVKLNGENVCLGEGSSPIMTSASSSVSVSTKPKGCPAGWDVLGSNCYKAFESELNWQDAENHCKGQGGHLASIHSKEENDFVAGLASPFHDEPWLGGTDVTGSWVWSDGSPFSFIAWGPDQPDNAGGKEHCLSTNWWGYGNWNDLDCSRTFASTDSAQKFICKIADNKF